ncbi:MAG: V-type ATP synthase subunit E [Lachnospiraceae bacterium]|nr:V-type ATP synthase subunit E [Lachnospiraceae bacterium]
MTGLEKILEQIKLEAKEESDKIIAAANEEAAVITSEGDKECAAIQASIDAKYASMKEVAKQRGDSTAALTERKLLLKAKQEIIDDVFVKAQKHLNSLDVADYFEFLAKLLNKYALKEKGEIILSAKDKKRITDDFKAEIEKHQLKVAKETGKFEGGFVLNYQDIEENCSFDAIFSAEKENLCDKIREMLFN